MRPVGMPVCSEPEAQHVLRLILVGRSANDGNEVQPKVRVVYDFGRLSKERLKESPTYPGDLLPSRRGVWLAAYMVWTDGR